VETVACSCSHMPPPYSSEIQQPMRTTATLGRYRPQTYVPGCTIDRDPDRADSLASRWSGRGSTSPPAPGIAQLGTGQPYAALVCTCPCACPVKHQAGLDTCPCAALPNLAVLDQGGAATRRRWLGVSAALRLRRHARRTPSRSCESPQISTAHPPRRPDACSWTLSPDRVWVRSQQRDARPVHATLPDADQGANQGISRARRTRPTRDRVAVTAIPLTCRG